MCNEESQHKERAHVVHYVPGTFCPSWFRRTEYPLHIALRMNALPILAQPGKLLGRRSVF